MPTIWEAQLFTTAPRKFLWVTFQIFFYAFRPLIVNPKKPVINEVFNFSLQLGFDAALCYYFGAKPLVYLIAGSLLCTGLHPVAGHFISEHYVFTKGHETYSYYGPINYITFNVGYHNEHHDFPSIPWSRLPLVKKIAHEYYDSLPQHTSMTRVIYDFIFDPSIGPYARIRRKGKRAANGIGYVREESKI